MEAILGALSSFLVWFLCLFFNNLSCYADIDTYKVEIRRIGPNIYDATDTFDRRQFRISTGNCSILGGEAEAYLAWNGKQGVLHAYAPGTVKSCTISRFEVR